MKKNKTKKQMCTAGIIALILVAIDQLTKYLAVINLKQSSTGVFVLIPGVFEFRYLDKSAIEIAAKSDNIEERITILPSYTALLKISKMKF